MRGYVWKDTGRPHAIGVGGDGIGMGCVTLMAIEWVVGIGQRVAGGRQRRRCLAVTFDDEERGRGGEGFCSAVRSLFGVGETSKRPNSAVEWVGWVMTQMVTHCVVR